MGMSRSSQFSLRMSTRLLCMSNPKRRRNQFALRRSTPLLAKSSNTKPPQLIPIKRRKEIDSYLRHGGIAGFNRRIRKYRANRFRLFYTIPDSFNIKERKTFICSCFTSARMDKSSGFTWVAVHGMDSICVVISTKALDVARLSGFSEFATDPSVFGHFTITLISDIEDLADPSIESSQTFDLPVKKRFAIVSVMPSTNDIPEVSQQISTAVSNEKAAIKYLQEKMNSDLVFTRTETIQTAAEALQLVVHQKLEANDFWVAVLEYNDITYFQVFENEKLLAVMNEPASGGLGSSGSSIACPTITDTV